MSMEAYDRIREALDQTVIVGDVEAHRVDTVEMDDLIAARDGLVAEVERLDVTIHAKQRLENPALPGHIAKMREAAARGEGARYTTDDNGHLMRIDESSKRSYMPPPEQDTVVDPFVDSYMAEYDAAMRPHFEQAAQAIHVIFGGLDRAFRIAQDELRGIKHNPVLDVEVRRVLQEHSLLNQLPPSPFRNRMERKFYEERESRGRYYRNLAEGRVPLPVWRSRFTAA